MKPKRKYTKILVASIVIGLALGVVMDMTDTRKYLRYIGLPPAERATIALKNVTSTYERNTKKPLLIVTWAKGDHGKVMQYMGWAIADIRGIHAVQSARTVYAPIGTGDEQRLSSMRMQAREVAEGFGDTTASWVLAGEVIEEDRSVEIHIIPGDGGEGGNLGIGGRKIYPTTRQGEKELREEIRRTIFPQANLFPRAENTSTSAKIFGTPKIFGTAMITQMSSHLDLLP